MKIAFSPPDIGEEEIAGVVDALRSGWITTGPKTKAFEAELARYCHTARAVCLSSATAAMELTLRLLGIGPGDEVITSAYTYTASAAVIAHVGAKLVLVDTAKGSYQMDYDRLAEAITPRTKAVIPVDVGGAMCDYDRIFAVLEEKKGLFCANNHRQAAFDRVIVIADAAHSLGATYNGERSGAVADFSCFSFHAVKNLTTAEGGAITWKKRQGMDDDEIYRELMLYALHGQSKDALAKLKPGAWEYDILFPGYKCNMTDISAAIGLAQLKRYESLLTRRREIMAVYDAALHPLGVETLAQDTTCGRGNGHLYLTRIPGIGETVRNELIQAMADAGIATNVHYKPLPLLTAYKNMGFDIADYPMAYAQYQNEITLPLHTLLSDDEAAYVAQTFASLIRG